MICMLNNIGCQTSPSQNHPQILSLSLVWAQAFFQNTSRSFSDDSRVHPGLRITVYSCLCYCVSSMLDGNFRWKQSLLKSKQMCFCSHSFINSKTIKWLLCSRHHDSYREYHKQEWHCPCFYGVCILVGENGEIHWQLNTWWGWVFW